MTTPLAQMLKDAGITQAHIADALGVTQATVSRKISGTSAWKVTELAQLAVMLETTPAKVLNAVSDDLGGAA
jgi:predicted transcriptional regulator